MKRKKLFITLSYIVCLVVGAISAVYFYNKINTHNKYAELEHKVYLIAEGEIDLLKKYCDTINLFLEKHPVNDIKPVNCDTFCLVESERTHYLGSLNLDYLKQTRRANLIACVIGVGGGALLNFLRKRINKKFNDKQV